MGKIIYCQHICCADECPCFHVHMHVNPDTQSTSNQPSNPNNGFSEVKKTSKDLKDIICIIFFLHHIISLWGKVSGTLVCKGNSYFVKDWNRKQEKEDKQEKAKFKESAPACPSSKIF